MPAAGLTATLRSIGPRAGIERPAMADSATGVATSDSGVRVAVTMIVSCAVAGEPYAAAEIADSQTMLDCMITRICSREREVWPTTMPFTRPIAPSAISDALAARLIFIRYDQSDHRVDDEPSGEKSDAFEHEAVKLVEHFGDHDGSQKARPLPFQQVSAPKVCQEVVHWPPSNLAARTGSRPRQEFTLERPMLAPRSPGNRRHAWSS